MNFVTESGSSPVEKARIEIIPLIDVVFFLLATFVLFTLSLKKIASIPVVMPQPSRIEDVADDQILYLQASEAGLFYWKMGRHAVYETMSAAEVSLRLETYRRSTIVPRVLVTGDEKAKFGATVFLLDEVRKAKIKQVAVETAP
jgi:biopolymer transport protein ExbD